VRSEAVPDGERIAAFLMSESTQYEICLDGITITVRMSLGKVYYRDEIGCWLEVYGPTADRVKQCIVDEYDVELSK